MGLRPEDGRMVGASAPPTPPGSLWITLEASEVMELKQIAMDRDGDGAVAFFQNEVLPRVRAAARQRGMALDILAEDMSGERVPG